ncbi:helix-turn-helix domain-containing protein [Streptomyces spectabilis]|uniref:helix-turn-helix domain-containing protein n=1 Tax=Streptomyces spectabilis TaxID=68270 RepID=UPI001CEF6C48|nr:XRE family transcriptional regulator [Streptomyces spectabilis]
MTGTVAGFVLRLARESISLTQVGMAEALGVDLGTVQGRESGRRPLANMRAADVLDLRRRLLTLGAETTVLGFIDAAMDADRLISAALEPPAELDQHPLAGWVHTRSTAHMIAWALNGTTPPLLRNRSALSRRGAVPAAPLLPVAERCAFFENLRTAVDAAAGASDRFVLLRRQALYLASYDHSAEGVSWTVHALHGRRDALICRGWTPRWVEARSTATALVRQGDTRPLSDFIARAMVDDDTAEAANLAYWAYWLGALPDAQPDDAFMRERTDWEPVTLFHNLVQGLHQVPGYVDLYAHTLWALLTTHHWLPQAAPGPAARLGDRATLLLDEGRVSAQGRRDLEAVHYVLRDHR